MAKCLLRLLLLRLCRLSGPEVADLLRLDVQRWPSQSTDFAQNLVALFLAYPEFRSVFFYRVRVRSIIRGLLRRIYPPQVTLYLRTPSIGPGLFIQHGFATTVGARRIGKNCWINQQVTIGYRDKTGRPTIGDDVTINAGAIVIGDISIGDRAVIGAGAVVVKSVPPDCTVVGVPAHIVRRKGTSVKEEL